MPEPHTASILIVDDDPGLLRLVQKAVQREGFSARTATSGQQAIALINQRPPDLMLLDLQLPDTRGAQLIDQLSAAGQPVPFIVITGQGDERVAVEMMKRGALDYLIKDSHFLEFVPAVVQRGVSQVERERKLAAAENNVRASEAQFRAAFDASSVGMFQADPVHGHLLRVNRRFCEMTGYDAAELIERPFCNITHPEDCAASMEGLARLRRGDDAAYHAEKRYLRPDGTVTWADLTVNLVRDANGVPLRTVAIAQDITERKRAEDALRQSEERFRSTLDNMIEGCQTLGFDWRYLYVNAAAARHGRRKVEELLGHTVMEVYPGFEHSELFGHLRECMTERREMHLESEFHHGNGESAWIQLSVQPAPEGLFVLSLDITKRKLADYRQKLQYDTALILAESPSLADAMRKILEAVCQTFRWDVGEFWRVDRAANVLRNIRAWPPGEAPSEFSAPFAFAPGIGVPGRAWRTRKPVSVPDLDSDATCARISLAKKLGMRSSFAFPIMLREEVLGVMSFFGRFPRSPDDDLLACFGALGSQIGQFIERKELEREVLEISDREQGRFGRDLHDGLGQQLTALELFSVGLANELQTQAPKLVKPMRAMGEHLREAISQTRAMAHGLSPVFLHDGGLDNALRKLASSLRTVAKIKCDVACPDPVEVEGGTATHLYRIAQEAANNALKHGGATKIRIHLANRDGLVSLSIEDNGRGFDPSHPGEAGMGLRAMKYRADLVGAGLDIESRPRKGTRVLCTLRKPSYIQP